MRKFHGVEAPSRDDAFVIAAAGGMIPGMQSLLDDGARVDAVLSRFGGAWHGGTALHCAARTGAVRSVDFLVAAGANLDSIDADSLTPLMRACSAGMVKGSRIALRLVEAGADVRPVRRSDDMTALKFSVKRCSPDVLQALIDHGAAVDGPRGTAQTALMIAARANNVESLRVLVVNGARVSRKCKLPWAEGRTAEGLAELEKRHKARGYLRSLRRPQS